MHSHDIHHLGGIYLSRYFCRIYPTLDSQSFVSELKILLNEFQCPVDRFDWFMGLSFMIFKGNAEMTRDFLSTLERYPDFSTCIWSLLSESTSGSLYTQCHILLGILEHDEPRITAFTLSGITPSQFSSLWFRECFVNVLNFNDLSIYLAGSLLFGSKFSVYTAAECISLLLKSKSLSLGIRSWITFNFKESDSWAKILRRLQAPPS
jgi:hypothetical protein